MTRTTYAPKRTTNATRRRRRVLRRNSRRIRRGDSVRWPHHDVPQMATEPVPDGRASRAEPPSGSASPGAALVAAPADTPQPAGRVRAFAYLDTESTHRYRQLMGVLLANKRRFGLRLSPAQITTRLWERFSVRYESPRRARARPEPAVRLGRGRQHPGQLAGLLDARVQAQALHIRHHRRRRDRRAGRAPGRPHRRARSVALERSQLPELLDALIALAGRGQAGPIPAIWKAGVAVQ